MTRCGVRFWARAVEGQEIGRDGPKGPTPSFRCFFFFVWKQSVFLLSPSLLSLSLTSPPLFVRHKTIVFYFPPRLRIREGRLY